MSATKLRGLIRLGREIAADPGSLGVHWTARRKPAELFDRYVDLARQAGIDRLYLVLSFDCDRPHDAEAAPLVNRRLLNVGVMSAYAVPGRLLERHGQTYAEIAATGAEFINHGWDDHAEFSHEKGHWISRWFYDTLPLDIIRTDVERGHQTVKQVVGTTPLGFRAPHFGTFQRPDQLEFLHQTLRSLGYSYGTTTSPAWAYREGPAFSRFGLTELPVSGQVDSPLDILDSWGFFEAPDRVRTPQQYEVEAKRLADRLAADGVGIINCYADPSHVVDRHEFFAAVDAWRQVAEPILPGDLVVALGGGTA